MSTVGLSLYPVFPNAFASFREKGLCYRCGWVSKTHWRLLSSSSFHIHRMRQYLPFFSFVYLKNLLQTQFFLANFVLKKGGGWRPVTYRKSISTLLETNSPLFDQFFHAFPLLYLVFISSRQYQRFIFYSIRIQ